MQPLLWCYRSFSDLSLDRWISTIIKDLWISTIIASVPEKLPPSMWECLTLDSDHVIWSRKKTVHYILLPQKLTWKDERLKYPYKSCSTAINFKCFGIWNCTFLKMDFKTSELRAIPLSLGKCKRNMLRNFLQIMTHVLKVNLNKYCSATERIFHLPKSLHNTNAIQNSVVTFAFTQTFLPLSYHQKCCGFRLQSLFKVIIFSYSRRTSGGEMKNLWKIIATFPAWKVFNCFTFLLISQCSVCIRTKQVQVFFPSPP